MPHDLFEPISTVPRKLGLEKMFSSPLLERHSSVGSTLSSQGSMSDIIANETYEHIAKICGRVFQVGGCFDTCFAL